MYFDRLFRGLNALSSHFGGRLSNDFLVSCAELIPSHFAHKIGFILYRVIQLVPVLNDILQNGVRGCRRNGAAISNTRLSAVYISA